MTEHPEFTASGSGARVRLILKERWRPGMSVAEGAGAIRQLIRETIPTTVDSFSGGTPSIDLVGPDGITTVEE
jgi:20S proteasome alpha/beta subunit